MDKTTRNELKTIIDDQIVKTQEAIKNLKESTKPIPPSNAIGRLSRMEAIGEKSVKDAALRHREIHLEGLLNASKMIENEDYGLCQECGEDIPFKRLKSVPYSVICTNCFDDNH